MIWVGKPLKLCSVLDSMSKGTWAESGRDANGLSGSRLTRRTRKSHHISVTGCLLLDNCVSGPGIITLIKSGSFLLQVFHHSRRLWVVETLQQESPPPPSPGCLQTRNQQHQNHSLEERSRHAVTQQPLTRVPPTPQAGISGKSIHSQLSFHTPRKKSKYFSCIDSTCIATLLFIMLYSGYLCILYNNLSSSYGCLFEYNVLWRMTNVTGGEPLKSDILLAYIWNIHINYMTRAHGNAKIVIALWYID